MGLRQAKSRRWTTKEKSFAESLINEMFRQAGKVAMPENVVQRTEMANKLHIQNK